MDDYRLSISGISVHEGLARFGGNRAIYEKILRRFPQDGSYREMCRAIEDKAAGGAFTAAHTLKGLAGNLSMKKLYDDLIPLVEELRTGSLARADELLRPVAADYSAVIAALTENAEGKI